MGFFFFFLSSLLLPVAVFWIPRVAFWIARPCSFQVVRQLVEHFPCLSISVSQAPVDRGTIILCFAQCSALPNFAPPFASDRALSVLTAPQSHWDLSAPSFHPACTPQNTHTYTPSHTHTQMHTFTSSLLSVSWKDKGWKWKAEQKLSKQRKKQRSEDICRDAKDNEILCPWFHYWLVFNLKQTANHIRDNLSTTLKHRRLLEAITALKLSRWIPGPIT